MYNIVFTRLYFFQHLSILPRRPNGIKGHHNIIGASDLFIGNIVSIHFYVIFLQQGYLSQGRNILTTEYLITIMYDQDFQ